MIEASNPSSHRRVSGIDPESETDGSTNIPVPELWVGTRGLGAPPVLLAALDEPSLPISRINAASYDPTTDDRAVLAVVDRLPDTHHSLLEVRTARSAPAYGPAVR